MTELGKVLAFFSCSLRSKRPKRLSGLLGSSGVWGLEGLQLPLPLLSVGLSRVTCNTHSHSFRRGELCSGDECARSRSVRDGVRSCRGWLTYTVSLSSLFHSQFGLSLAPMLLSVLLLLPEALLLLQSQSDPQGSGLLLLHPGTVQGVSALQGRFFYTGTHRYLFLV